MIGRVGQRFPTAQGMYRRTDQRHLWLGVLQHIVLKPQGIAYHDTKSWDILHVSAPVRGSSAGEPKTDGI